MSARRMTSRQRILTALRREEVDYAPCCAAFNPLTPVQRRGHGWRFPWPPDASAETQLAYQVEQLGLDQVVPVGIDLCRPSDGVESRVWLDGGVLHKAYTTPSGSLHASVRCDDLWPHGQDIPLFSDFNVGHFVKPWVENESDVDCLRHVLRLAETPEALREARAAFEQAKTLADRYDLATIAHVGAGLTGAQQMFGVTQLCLMTVESPDIVNAYMEHEHRINLRAIELVGDFGVDIVRRNGFYETADFYGPETLERFVGPRVRREAEAARAAGMLTSYTVHTGLMPILDYLSSLTVDSFFGIDIAFKGVDLRRLRDRLAPGKCLWTGPSSTYHLWSGAEATRRAVRQVFEVFGGRGLILAPCVSAHSIMPWESTLSMIDEWKKLRSAHVG